MEQKTQVDYVLRVPALDDVQAVVTFLNDCQEALLCRRPYTVADVRRRWTSPNFELAKSARMAVNEQGNIVGMVIIWDTANPPVTPWLNIEIHPDWEETDLGDVLMAWGEERCQACLARVPADTRVSIVVGALQQHEALKRLFDRHGYVETRHFWEMEIVLDQPPQAPVWPGDFSPIHFSTKAEVEANLEPIVAAIDDAFQDHFGYVQRPLADMVTNWQHRIDTDPKRFDPTLWFLAMDGDEIAAVCICVKEDFDDPEKGHVNVLGVRRPWRRRGLGLAILLHSFQEFYRRGKTAVTLGVDASSITNATELYKKAGMHVARQYDNYEKELRPGKDIIRRE